MAEKKQKLTASDFVNLHNHTQYSYVYIDESGDFGRAESSSCHLIVTSLATNHPRPLEKVVKKIWRAKPHLHRDHELHAHQADDITRKKLLSAIANLDIKICLTPLDKRASTRDVHKMYYKLLAEQVRYHKNAHIIIVDRRDTTKKRIQIINELGFTDLFKRVQFADSRTIKQLQAVDFVSWAAYQRYEHHNDMYLDIVADKIEVDI